MKYITTCLIALLLSGCSWFTPPTFDNNEYLLFAEIETHARFLVNDCDSGTTTTKRIHQLLFRSETLQTYSHYRLNNSELHTSSATLNKQIVELVARYRTEPYPSPTYCKIKARILVMESRNLLKTIGKLQGIDE